MPPEVLSDRITKNNNWAFTEDDADNAFVRRVWQNDIIPSEQQYRKERHFAGLASLGAIGTLTFSEKVTIKQHCFLVSSRLSSIIDEIKRSEFILDLKENWDEDGAEKISGDTWYKAITFLINYSTALLDSNIVVEAPEINPCPDGSIDLSWRTRNARLLINIQNKANGQAVYYGDLYDDKMQVKGSVPIIGIHEHLTIWMKYLNPISGFVINPLAF